MTIQFIERYGVKDNLRDESARAEEYDVIVIGAGQAGLAVGY